MARHRPHPHATPARPGTGTPAPAGRPRGFTLVELLLSVSLGAVLIIAVVHSTGLYSTQAGSVMAQSDRAVEEALAHVGEAVEQAWLVDHVSDTQIDVYDPLGNATTYWLDRSTLWIRRPSGDTAALLEGVDTLAFSVGTQTRLREDDPLEGDGVVWERDVGEVDDLEGPRLPIVGGATYTEEFPPEYDEAGAPGLLRSGDSLAVGFKVPVAREDVVVVDGVTEFMEVAAFDRLTLPIGLLDELPSPPFSLDAEVAAGEELPGAEKVTLCHTTAKGLSHAITVGTAARDAHLAHGDVLAACPPDPGTLTVEIYEARSFDDARPYGNALGSVSFAASGLPAVSSHFEGIDDEDVVVYEPDAALVLDPPGETISLDLAAAGVSLEPGVPYTVIVSYEGSGLVSFASADSTDPLTGVATLMSGESDWGSAALAVEAAVSGAYTVTQTAAHDVVNRVTTTIAMADGRRVASSMLVASQVAVPEPWHGAVPGEFPTLELRGQ